MLRFLHLHLLQLYLLALLNKYIVSLGVKIVVSNLSSFATQSHCLHLSYAVIQCQIQQVGQFSTSAVSGYETAQVLTIGVSFY